MHKQLNCWRRTLISALASSKRHPDAAAPPSKSSLDLNHHTPTLVMTTHRASQVPFKLPTLVAFLCPSEHFSKSPCFRIGPIGRCQENATTALSEGTNWEAIRSSGCKPRASSKHKRLVKVRRSDHLENHSATREGSKQVRKCQGQPSGPAVTGFRGSSGTETAIAEPRLPIGSSLVDASGRERNEKLTTSSGSLSGSGSRAAPPPAFFSIGLVRVRLGPTFPLLPK